MLYACITKPQLWLAEGRDGRRRYIILSNVAFTRSRARARLRSGELMHKSRSKGAQHYYILYIYTLWPIYRIYTLHTV